MTNERITKIESLILEACTNEWQKIAVIIGKIFDAPDFDAQSTNAQDIAERLYIMVDSGKIDVQGNMRRWRAGAVRLLPAR